MHPLITRFLTNYNLIHILDKGRGGGFSRRPPGKGYYYYYYYDVRVGVLKIVRESFDDWKRHRERNERERGRGSSRGDAEGWRCSKVVFANFF